MSDAATSEATPEGTAGSAAGVGAAVVIPVNAFDPANADRAYDPLTLTVTAGTTVRWTNSDVIAHTVMSGTSNGSVGTPDGQFDSGFMNPGATFTFTFDDVGEYDYYCTPHPWMQGKVIVTPAN